MILCADLTFFALIMKTPEVLFLPNVSGKFMPDDRVPTMVVVPYSAKQALQELLMATAKFQHPNLSYNLFSGLATGARLLCALEDLQQECLAGGMDLVGLESTDTGGEHSWTDETGQAFGPYLLSDPDHEPEIVVWKDGSITLRWDAVDSEGGEQPLESDFFNLDDLEPVSLQG